MIHSFFSEKSLYRHEKNYDPTNSGAHRW